jgi:ADP-ribosylglycohydrolase
VAAAISLTRCGTVDRMGNRTAAHHALRGIALGDAFGERFFSKPPDALDKMLGEHWLPAGPWKWTDDTAMAVSVLRVLEDLGHVDQDALAALFVAEYRRDPYRNYGSGAHDVLTAIGKGAEWGPVAQAVFDGRGSWGNGAAMRVAPLGAWFAADLDTVVAEARKSAQVTHAHPEGQAGAVAVAVAAAVAVSGAKAQGVLDEARSRTPAGAVRTGLDEALAIPFGTDPREAAGLLGCGHRISAQDTVPYAIWCAARHLDDLPGALWATVSAGGDMDTTCAIVGGIVAARTGPVVPSSWLAAAEPVPDWVLR